MKKKEKKMAWQKPTLEEYSQDIVQAGMFAHLMENVTSLFTYKPS